MVVTHGGVIREILRYLNTLQCDLPSNALRITPNTGVSEFLITCDDTHFLAARCLKIHNVDHLDEKQKKTVLSEEQINDNAKEQIL